MVLAAVLPRVDERLGLEGDGLVSTHAALGSGRRAGRVDDEGSAGQRERVGEFGQQRGRAAAAGRGLREGGDGD